MSAAVPLAGLDVAGRKQPVTLCVYMRRPFFFFLSFPPWKEGQQSHKQHCLQEKKPSLQKARSRLQGLEGGLKGVGTEG